MTRRAKSFGFIGGLAAFASIFIAGGFLHFLLPGPYLRIIPPILPRPKLLLEISGAAEILGGVGLLLRPFRRAAAYGLALLLIAVFPANIYMAVAHIPFPGLMGQSWVQWLRLPLQIPLFGWALYYTKSQNPRTIRTSPARTAA
jgi:uncharacterized membrane protein